MRERQRRSSKRAVKEALEFQNLFVRSKDPEELLFKINEFINSQRISSTRKNIRVAVSIPVVYWVNDEEIISSTYTLSKQGMFIKTSNPLDVNSKLELIIKLPTTNEIIKAEGEVLSSISPEEATEKGGIAGMAVIFRKIKQKHQKELEKFVRTRLKEVYK